MNVDFFTNNIFWVMKYNKLVKFMKINPFPKLNNPEFGFWINRQRAYYRAGKLSKNQISLLESHSWWTWCDVKWFNKFYEFKIYMDSGNNFPKQSDPIFGPWINTQRMKYKTNQLSDDRIILLESNKWWTWRYETDDSKWMNWYTTLKEYVANNGFPYVSNSQLGSWISRQRHLYFKGKLSSNRFEILNSSDWWAWGK